MTAASRAPGTPATRLSAEREKRLRDLQVEFMLGTPSGKQFDRAEMLTLRDDLNAMLGEIDALRAQLADARVELKTVVDSVDDALFAMREPMTLGEARKGRAILTSYSVRRAIAAARAASGEDASNEQAGRTHQETE